MKSLKWNSNGTITEKRDPAHRMVFLDSDGLDVLFFNIEDLIGVPIEQIIIESKSKATREFTRKVLHGIKGKLVRLVGLERAIGRMSDIAVVFGYGRFKIVELDWDGDYVCWRLNDPYSLPLICGDLRGATEAIRNDEGVVSYRKEPDDSYILEGRLNRRHGGKA
jgi:hypothetical protein